MTEPASEPKYVEDHGRLQPNCSVFSQLQKGSSNSKTEKKTKPCCLMNRYKRVFFSKIVFTSNGKSPRLLHLPSTEIKTGNSRVLQHLLKED